MSGNRQSRHPVWQPSGFEKTPCGSYGIQDGKGGSDKGLEINPISAGEKAAFYGRAKVTHPPKPSRKRADAAWLADYMARNPRKVASA